MDPRSWLASCAYKHKCAGFVSAPGAISACWEETRGIMQDHFKKKRNFPITLKYIDPTYMIRAVRSNASDNVYCTLLAHSAIHGAMAGYTGFTVAPVNGSHAYIPFYVSPEHSFSMINL